MAERIEMGTVYGNAPIDDCVGIGGLAGRKVAYAVYAGSENGKASVQIFFDDGTGFVIWASGRWDVLDFRQVEQIPGALSASTEVGNGS
jgi:hypothetical protein